MLRNRPTEMASLMPVPSESMSASGMAPSAGRAVPQIRLRNSLQTWSSHAETSYERSTQAPS